MDEVSKKVYDAIKSTADALGYEIVDVEYLKKQGDMHLTVYIYQESGIGFDDCERFHLAIDQIIDEINPSKDSPYFLNVSSPGLDRPFKTARDFERNYGKEVEIKLYAPLMGKKYIEGVLVEKRENTVQVLFDGQVTQLELSKIVYVRPLVRFS